MNNNLIIEFFAKYIESQLGIIYSEANYFQLEHRLQEVAKLLNFNDIQALYSEASKGISLNLKYQLLNIATNNETSFFRDPAIFRCFSELVLEDMAKRPNQSNIKIWSAASSAGQEAYSLAMAVDQFKSTKNQFFEIKFLLSDVSDKILKRAKDGVYSKLEIERGLSPELKLKYFESVDQENWKVKSFLKSSMEYKELNLLDDWFGIGPFDIIFCRNVLIYLSVENKKKVIEKMANLLNPEGYLFLGSAESLFGLSEKFNQVSYQGAITYKKK